MKVSVVIPVYNEEKYIKNCLNSLMRQEEKPDEIIVVDNNCTDNTINVVKKYKNIKVIRERKQGIIAARNAGFDHAQGDIIARCDADAILPSDWIKKIKHDFNSNKKILGVTTAFIIFDFPFINQSLLPFKIYNFFSQIILKTPVFLGPSMAITKEVWGIVKNQVCLDDSKVHEDIDLTIHISKYGLIYLDKSLIINYSSRRIKHNPLSFFVEYPLRLAKMLKIHRYFI